MGVAPRIKWALNSFMHGDAIRITGRQQRRGWEGKWFYPSLERAMKEAGFKDIRASINNRQNTVAKYIAMQPLMDLCEGTNQVGGRLKRILSREGADKRVSGNFFKAVVQQVLLFGSETWVVAPIIEIRESTEMAFGVYRKQLKTVPSFK